MKDNVDEVKDAAEEDKYPPLPIGWDNFPLSRVPNKRNTAVFLGILQVLNNKWDHGLLQCGHNWFLAKSVISYI